MNLLDKKNNKILDKTLEMFDVVIKAHKDAIQALIESDNRNALLVVDNDSKINYLEEQINYDVMIAIAKYQPVASDLRRLISYIKVSNDLERIGDYAKTIARSAIVNSDKTFLTDSFLKNALAMSNIITTLLLEAKDAFINSDVDKAYQLIRNENQLELLMKSAISSNPFSEIKDNNVESFMLLMGVIRTLERSRGHLANICEAIIFVGNGEFVEL